MQPFFQQTILDGTPLWIIIAKDVIIPLLALIGGSVGFCVWYRRKRIEHKLMHQTKAYELLLDMELKYYEEIIPLVDDIDYKVKDMECDVFNGEIQKGYSGLNRIHPYHESLFKLRNKSSIYINQEVSKKLKELEDCLFGFYISITNIVNGFEKTEESVDKIEKANEFLHKAEIIVPELKTLIKKHLEEMSYIK